MSDFVAGFAARHDASPVDMARAFSRCAGFAAADPRHSAGAIVPTTFAPQPGPRHFSPADPSVNPTEGWDPLDPTPQDVVVLDPIEAARAEGYAEGLAAAVNEAGERDRALLAGLGDELASGGRIDRERVAEQLRQTVLFLVAKVVGEVGIAPDILAKRIESASDLLADATESALLRVHPDDVALLEGRLPPTIFAAGDPGVARGSFVLESASTIVEDGPALWLDQLERAMEQAPVPAAS